MNESDWSLRPAFFRHLDTLPIIANTFPSDPVSLHVGLDIFIHLDFSLCYITHAKYIKFLDYINLLELIIILTDLKFIDIGKPWPVVDADENSRLQEHVRSRKLYDELHDQVFPKYAKYLTESKGLDDKIQKIVIGLAETAVQNYLDLLIGEPPIIEAPFIYPIPDEELYIDASRYGIGLLEISQSGINVLNPEQVYMVLNPSDMRDVLAYVIFHEFEVKDKNKTKKYVKLTIHQKGSIQHLLYFIKDGKLNKNIDLSEFDQYSDLEVGEDGVQETGIDEMLIVRADNSLSSDRYYGRSDYTPSVYTLIEALDLAFARRAEVLAKFSRPIPMVPEGAMQFDHASGRWKFKTDNAIIIKEGQPSAAYLTWSASLGDVQIEIKDLFDQLLMKLKLSRVLLAGDNAGTAESGTSLRIRLIPTLSKVRKFASSYKKIVPQAFSLKSKLDDTLGIGEVAAFEPEDVEVEMQDGIPNVPLEDAQLRLINAQTIGQLKTAGVLDSKSAIRAAILMNVIEKESIMPSEDVDIENAILQSQISSSQETGY